MTYHRGTLDEFNFWHDSVKVLEGIIEEGKVGSIDGKLMPENQRTIEYSKATLHPSNENDYIWMYGNYIDENKTSLSLSDVKTAGWITEEV